MSDTLRAVGRILEKLIALFHGDCSHVSVAHLLKEGIVSLLEEPSSKSLLVCLLATAQTALHGMHNVASSLISESFHFPNKFILNPVHQPVIFLCERLHLGFDTQH